MLKEADRYFDSGLSRQIAENSDQWEAWAKLGDDAHPSLADVSEAELKYVAPVLTKVFFPQRLLSWLFKEAEKDLQISSVSIPNINAIADEILPAMHQRTVMLLENPKLQSTLLQQVGKEAVRRGLHDKDTVVMLDAQFSPWNMIQEVLDDVEARGGWVIISSLSLRSGYLTRIASWLQATAAIGNPSFRLFLHFADEVGVQPFSFDEYVQESFAIQFLLQSSYVIKAAPSDSWASMGAEALKILDFEKHKASSNLANALIRCAVLHVVLAHHYPRFYPRSQKTTVSLQLTERCSILLAKGCLGFLLLSQIWCFY